MTKRKSFLMKFTLAVLIFGFSCPAVAERLQERYSQGNNIQVYMHQGWAAPLRTNQGFQFPKGSGNYIGNDAMLYGHATARDFDGDGVAEDTMDLNGGGRNMSGFLCSLEGYDVLKGLYDAGENMLDAAARVEYARIWTSLDPEELAAWPAEGREGRSPGGKPILYGAETMFCYTGDVFNTSDGPTNGVSADWTLYFLDYGESNNMAYVHYFMRNVTEYMKWNPNPTYAEVGAAHPDGWDWKGFVMHWNTRHMGYGGSYAGHRMAWCYHNAKEIVGAYSREAQLDIFAPKYPPLFGYKMLRKPHLRDQQMELTENFVYCSYGAGCAFGFGKSVNNVSQHGPIGETYEQIKGAMKYYPGVINVWSGREYDGSYPGLLQPGDSRYNQWIWGGQNEDQGIGYSELFDVAPRDSMSCDFVIFYTYPGVLPFEPPELDVANIDDPIMQEGLAPLETYAEVAEIVLNGGYVVPETPVPPPLTIVPGDKQVTITWSDVNLHTSDAYYYFIQENPELDPNGVYREYDFEGYRLYRSYVGPNDSHAEVIWEGSLTQDNIQFYFVDRLDDDVNYRRMRNGIKIWYALVPYDLNYNVQDGEPFSLPALTSGKKWTGTGSRPNVVIPRSDATNFRSAAYGGSSYVGIATEPDASTELGGDGTGKLTESPKLLTPELNFGIIPVNDERIDQDMSVYVACTGLKAEYPSPNPIPCTPWAYPMRVMSTLDANGNILYSSFFKAKEDSEIMLSDAPGEEGVSFLVKVNYIYTGPTARATAQKLYYNLDFGGYTGAELSIPYTTCSGGNVGTNPSIGAYIGTGEWELTWKESGTGLTVEIMDKLRGTSVDHVQYTDDMGWGFMPAGTYGAFYDDVKFEVPRADRANQLLDEIPADNTEEFAIWLNGLVWRLRNVTAMPTAGTVFKFTTCFGDWNEDQTVFTQVSGPPFFGDKWKIDIKKYSMDPDSADLEKIRVVPNPYIASSFLDLSPRNRRIEFVNLPDQCTIRIYSLTGVLVNVLNHIGANRNGWGNYTDWDILSDSQPKVLTGYDNHGGTEPWNLRNRFGQNIASGLYFYHVTDSRGKEYVGKFYVIL